MSAKRSFFVSVANFKHFPLQESLPSCAGAGKMPIERTEHRGADELQRYYEVYETIGSGNARVN